MLRRPFAFAALAGLLAPLAVRGQALAESQVKARIVLNLARFTQWPAQAFADGASPYLWCAAVRGPLLERAFAALSGEVVAGRTVALQMGPPAVSRGCHLLFVDADSERSVTHLLAEAAAAPLLTIGDGDGFSRRGIVGLVNNNDAIGFDINLTRMRAAQLNISSQVLRLARRVHE